MSGPFTHRSDQLEIMDDLNCHGNVLVQTLKELEIINRWLGGDQATISGLSKLINYKHQQQEIIEIVDLGCGGGDVLKAVAKWARNSGLKLQLTGIDANPHIVDYARANSLEFPEISYQTMDIFSNQFSQRVYDIAVCTLFAHHFSDTQLKNLFKLLHQQARLGVVVNDLHRHWLAYYFIKWVVYFFSKSHMVKNDAPLSVLRGFRRSDINGIMAGTGVGQFELTWKWAFRWRLIF